MTTTLQQDLRRRVEDAIRTYEDGYEAERAYYAEHLPSHEVPDYRKRNAGLDLNKLQLFYVPATTQRAVFFHYDDVFASIPWRTLTPVVVYKETPKLLMVGYDCDLERLNFGSRAELADPGDPIDLDSLRIGSSLEFAFRQIAKSELGNRIFRTAQEAFDALPAEHKLTRAEMECRVAEAESNRDAQLNGEDEARRAQPCARCQQPIGVRAYTRHLGGLTRDRSLQYIHFDCRKCESCGETITGEYVQVDVKQDTQPQSLGGGVRLYSGPHYLGMVYYHAGCAYEAGVKPTHGGGRNEKYGFYTHIAENDIQGGWGDLPS